MTCYESYQTIFTVNVLFFIGSMDESGFFLDIAIMRPVALLKIVQRVQLLHPVKLLNSITVETYNRYFENCQGRCETNL